MTKGQQGYRLESPLGTGGFSEVWRATDLETGEAVAVKVARADRGTEANAKLREEATILRALNHPNIVRILDWGVEDESEFLVTELIDGPTLRDVLRESGALSDEEVLAMGAALADALAAAHEAGFVHGDVKPENIIIRSGTPYLIDFGTARNLAETLRPDELREVAGTLAYLAPELLAGEALSPQSDVYALGVTLYEARSGRLPFAGGGGTLVGSEGRRASPLRHTSPGVDARLESAIMESLAVDPAWRLATAAEVRERLVSGWHDTVQLRPPRSSAAAPALGAGAPAAAALGADAAVASAMAPPSRVAFSNLDDALLEPQDSGPARPRCVLAVVAVLSLLLLGAFGAMSLLRRDARESYQPAGRDESPVAAVASPESPTVAPTSPAEGSPTLTPDPPTSTPSATASPTPDPPTATPPPHTPTPADTQQTEAQLDAQSGAGRVLQWYDLVVADRFDDAYALWSDRMRANFPREENLDGRWANTVSISVNDLRVLSASGDQMIVAIDFVETLANGSSRRFVGSWQLVASDSGWLLDSPTF